MADRAGGIWALDERQREALARQKRRKLVDVYHFSDSFTCKNKFLPLKECLSHISKTLGGPLEGVKLYPDMESETTFHADSQADGNVAVAVNWGLLREVTYQDGKLDSIKLWR